VITTTEEVNGIEVPSVDADRRPGDPTEVYGDNRRAEELLGWRAEHDLASILRTAYAWHSTHPDGYGRAGG